MSCLIFLSFVPFRAVAVQITWTTLPTVHFAILKLGQCDARGQTVAGTSNEMLFIGSGLCRTHATPIKK